MSFVVSPRLKDVISHQLMRWLFGVDLRERVATFEKEMPRSFEKTKKQGYTLPTEEQRAAMNSVFTKIVENDLRGARKVLRDKKLNYRVEQVLELKTERWLVILAEYPVDSTWTHAWGMYVFSPASSSRVIVEVPHPVFDTHSEAVGVEAFLYGNAKALFVAGAHRHANGMPGADEAQDEADVAHRVDSVFETIHRRVIGAVTDVLELQLHGRVIGSVRDARVLQLHGFAADPGVAEKVAVVVSAGTDSTDVSPPTLANQVHDALLKNAFATCLFSSSDCTGLGATTNVQMQSCEGNNVPFVHVEMASSVRKDVAGRNKLAAIVMDTLNWRPIVVTPVK